MSMGEAGFHLGFDSIKGRQLIAQRVYQVGELIFEEDPLVVSQFEWNKLYKYLACDYCLYPLESCEKNLRRLCQEPSIVLPHPECDVNANIEQRLVRCVKCQEIFCSMSCYEQAWNSYHATLCSFQENRLFKEILDLWRSAHPPPETTTISLVLKLMAMLKQSSNRSQLLGELQKFSQGVQSDNQKFFHKLLRKEFEPQVEQLRAALEQFNDQYMQIEEFRWFLTAHGFRQLLALLGRNQQGIGTSVLAMWVKQTETLPDSSSTASASSDLSQWIDAIYTKIDEVSGEFIDCEGSGLFRLQSCLNHSCDANAEIQYRHHNSRLSVVTTKMIAANEEITINYLSECDRNRSRHSRRKILRENYLFDCQCARCALESNEADVTSDEEEEEMDDD